MPVLIFYLKIRMRYNSLRVQISKEWILLEIGLINSEDETSFRIGIDFKSVGKSCKFAKCYCPCVHPTRLLLFPQMLNNFLGDFKLLLKTIPTFPSISKVIRVFLSHIREPECFLHQRNKLYREQDDTELKIL